MTRFLIRTFVKNYNNTQDDKVRESYGMLGSFVGIVSNTVLFALKFVIGIVLNSVAITADSFNNLSDSASSIITMIGFKMGNQPPDNEHPYGHGRMEYISAFVVSFFIMLLGIEFLKTSVRKIFNPEIVEFKWLSVIILIITIIVKMWQGRFNKYVGNKINSQSLIATATDSMNDVLVTSVTVLSLFITKFCAITVDGYFGVFVALVLLYSGFNLAKETLSPLIGEGSDGELTDKIKNMICSYDGILGVHDLMVHNYGPNKSMASIHAEVPCNVDINISHEIIDKIERDISKKLGITLVIHMDPIDNTDKRIKVISQSVKNYLYSIDDKFDAHDFRIIDGKNNVNVIFDVIIPRRFKANEQNEIVSNIKRIVSKIDSKYTCVINIEYGFEKH